MARSFKGRSSISAATSRVFVSTGPGGTIGVEIPYLASAIGEGVGSVPSLVGTTSHRQSKNDGKETAGNTHNNRPLGSFALGTE